MGLLTSFARVIKFPKVNLDKYDTLRQENEGQQIIIPKDAQLSSQLQQTIANFEHLTTGLQQTTLVGTGGPSVTEIDLIALTTIKYKLKFLSIWAQHIDGFIRGFKIEVIVTKVLSVGETVIATFILSLGTPNTNVGELSHNCLNLLIPDWILEKNMRIYAQRRITSYTGAIFEWKATATIEPF